MPIARRYPLRLAIPLALCAFALTLLYPSTGRTQEPTWSVRAGAGVLIPTDRASFLVDVHTGMRVDPAAAAFSVDVLRQVDCCTELYLSGAVPIIGVELYSGADTVDAGSVTPVMLQLGLNHRLHRRSHTTTRVRQWLYLSPFVTVLTGDRSRLTELDRATTPRFAAAELLPSLGVGLGVGWRYRQSETLAWDINAKWQYLPIRAGGNGRLPLSPFGISAGVVARLF
jgi:hypothetical protein